MGSWLYFQVKIESYFIIKTITNTIEQSVVKVKLLRCLLVF